MEITVNSKPQETYSENCDCSENSLSEGTCAACGLKTEETRVMSQIVTRNKTRKTQRNCRNRRIAETLMVE